MLHIVFQRSQPIVVLYTVCGTALKKGNYENHKISRKFYWASYKNSMIFLAPRKRELLYTPSFTWEKHLHGKEGEKSYNVFMIILPLTFAP